MRILVLLLALSLGVVTARAAELTPGAKIAYFGIHFIDTSTEGAINGARDDEAARLEMLRDYVAQDLRDRGFELVDLAPVAEQLDRIVNPADCNYCDVYMARDLGADYSLVGEVQKVSNLILSMNLVVRDAAEGQHVRGLSVDIRGQYRRKLGPGRPLYPEEQHLPEAIVRPARRGVDGPQDGFHECELQNGRCVR